MKIQDYGKVVSRMHTREHLKQEVINMAIEKQARRPRINAIGLTAAAVAAVCLGVNGLFAYSIIKMHNQPDVSSGMQTTSTVQNENLPVYNIRANEMFSQRSGENVCMDLTAYGTELDYTWELEGYTVQLLGAVGSEYTLYYFYDVIPNAGQDWGQFQQEFPAVGLMWMYGSDCQIMPVTGGRTAFTEQTEDGVWHCYGMMHTLNGVSLDGQTMRAYVGQETDVFDFTVDFVKPSQREQLRQAFSYELPSGDPLSGDNYAICWAEISPFGIFFNSGTELYGGDYAGFSPHCTRNDMREQVASISAVLRDGSTVPVTLSEESFQAYLENADTDDVLRTVGLVFSRPYDLATISYFDTVTGAQCEIPVAPDAPNRCNEDSAEILKMPNLIGMNFTEAQQMFGGQIQIQVERREYSTVEEGRIFDQSIPANAPVVKGDTVQVAVSLGISKVALPDVRNWSFWLAKETLVDIGLNVEKCMSYSDDVEEGIVISTDPQGPVDLEPGTRVCVMVSLGKNETNAATVRVPNFINMDWDHARSTAEAMGLIVMKEDEDDNAPAGKVLYQYVGVGEEVPEGSVITLRVSTGSPKLTEVRIVFKIPENANGTFCITLYQEGIARAVGGEFNPAYASGVTSVTMEGYGETDVNAVLQNTDTGATATIGTYHVDYDHQTCDTLSEDIAAAFAAVGGLK